MSKPDWCPQEVWDEAGEYAARFFGTGLTALIARAILAAEKRGEEREREAFEATGFVLVPKSALDWLNGEAPDAVGKWFGDDVPQGKPYWWRGRFRAMIDAAQVKP